MCLLDNSSIQKSLHFSTAINAQRYTNSFMCLWATKKKGNYNVGDFFFGWTDKLVKKKKKRDVCLQFGRREKMLQL